MKRSPPPPFNLPFPVEAPADHDAGHLWKLAEETYVSVRPDRRPALPTPLLNEVRAARFALLSTDRQVLLSLATRAERDARSKTFQHLDTAVRDRLWGYTAVAAVQAYFYFLADNLMVWDPGEGCYLPAPAGASERFEVLAGLCFWDPHVGCGLVAAYAGVSEIARAHPDIAKAARKLCVAARAEKSKAE